MRSSVIALSVVFSAFGTMALAGEAPTFGPSQINPNAVGSVQPPAFQPTDCGTGFTKLNVNGSPTSQSYSYTCETPVLYCPPAPANMTGGMNGPAAVAKPKNGEMFKYSCSWSIPPK